MQTSDWISLGAAILSLVALGVSLYEAISNKPRLRIKSKFAILSASPGSFLNVEIINYGRQPTTITRLGIDIPGTKAKVAMAPVSPGSTLPHVLQVGHSADFLIPCDRPLQDLFNPGVSGTIQSILEKPGARISVVDAWHSKPHFTTVS